MSKNKLELHLTKQRNHKYRAYDSSKESWKQVVDSVNAAYSEGAAVKIKITFGGKKNGKDNK